MPTPQDIIPYLDRLPAAWRTHEETWRAELTGRVFFQPYQPAADRFNLICGPEMIDTEGGTSCHQRFSLSGWLNLAFEGRLPGLEVSIRGNNLTVFSPKPFTSESYVVAVANIKQLLEELLPQGMLAAIGPVNEADLVERALAERAARIRQSPISSIPLDGRLISPGVSVREVDVDFSGPIGVEGSPGVAGLTGRPDWRDPAWRPTGGLPPREDVEARGAVAGPLVTGGLPDQTSGRTDQAAGAVNPAGEVLIGGQEYRFTIISTPITTGRSYRSVSDLMRGENVSPEVQHKVAELEAQDRIADHEET